MSGPNSANAALLSSTRYRRITDPNPAGHRPPGPGHRRDDSMIPPRPGRAAGCRPGPGAEDRGAN
eukprot:336416-Hanusia_phi.AAC.1